MAGTAVLGSSERAWPCWAAVTAGMWLRRVVAISSVH